MQFTDPKNLITFFTSPVIDYPADWENENDYDAISTKEARKFTRKPQKGMMSR